MDFPTGYQQILERIENIHPIKYAKTRNYTDGAVTGLSPYISRGVISLPQVKAAVLQRYKPYEAEKLLQELAWREYFQRVWQAVGDKIFSDLRQPQPMTQHHKMIAAIQNAETGITAVDDSIQQLYKTGYMHNHFRMYIASICCNIGRAHWLQASRWLYYHLLDGDLASNSLSWQWVSGAFSSKKYYCNQENINKYSNTLQKETFLDVTYDTLTTMDVPANIEATHDCNFITLLPQNNLPVIQSGMPTLIYNAYNLDPLWHSDIAANRILLLEPSHFKNHPVSINVINFITALSKNIKDIQIYTAEFNDLEKLAPAQDIIFKAHPAFGHYRGKAESYDYMFAKVSGYYPSFSGYWKRCTKYLG